MEKCKECGCIIHNSSTRRKRIEELIKANEKYDGLLDVLCVTCINNEQIKLKRNERLMKRALQMQKLQERTKKIEEV